MGKGAIPIRERSNAQVSFFPIRRPRTFIDSAPPYTALVLCVVGHIYSVLRGGAAILEGYTTNQKSRKLASLKYSL